MGVVGGGRGLLSKPLWKPRALGKLRVRGHKRSIRLYTVAYAYELKAFLLGAVRFPMLGSRLGDGQT